MLARSSLLVWLAGCDVAFGVNGQPEPCELASFDGVEPRVVVAADQFSVDWDQTFAVFTRDTIAYELALPDGEPVQIDLGIYLPLSVSLTPEADALLYTIAVEPRELKGALRGDASWRLDAEVPRGTMAGTPSADSFGPRRVMVRIRENDETVQEYEDVAGRWMPVGEPWRIPGVYAPNLTPNGLTVVYATIDGNRTPVIVAAQRRSVTAPFGEPTILLEGEYRTPQLCGRCEQLYAIVDDQLVVFDR